MTGRVMSADGGLAVGGVVAEFLDVQQAPGGGEAGLPAARAGYGAACRCRSRARR